jgi:hypothetical protein
VTPKRPIGERRGMGRSRGDSSLSSIGRLGVFYDSQPHGNACLNMCVAARNRVKTRCSSTAVGGVDQTY